MYPRYTLDIVAISATSTRIVIAAGQASRGHFPHRVATLLAERLGTAVVEFPSHHAGYVSHPRAFAEQLRNCSARKLERKAWYQRGANTAHLDANDNTNFEQSDWQVAPGEGLLG